MEFSTSIHGKGKSLSGISVRKPLEKSASEMENKSKRELNAAKVINLQYTNLSWKQQWISLIILVIHVWLYVLFLYNATHTVKKQEPKLGSKDQQRSAEESKGNKNHCIWHNQCNSNLQYIFFVPDTVTRTPQNLYLVQLYQNTGDYLYDNVAAVTVSLHHPLYAMVSELSPSFKWSLRKLYSKISYGQSSGHKWTTFGNGALSVNKCVKWKEWEYSDFDFLVFI